MSRIYCRLCRNRTTYTRNLTRKRIRSCCQFSKCNLFTTDRSSRAPPTSLIFFVLLQTKAPQKDPQISQAAFFYGTLRRCRNGVVCFSTNFLNGRSGPQRIEKNYCQRYSTNRVVNGSFTNCQTHLVLFSGLVIDVQNSRNVWSHLGQFITFD